MDDIILCSFRIGGHFFRASIIGNVNPTLDAHKQSLCVDRSRRRCSAYYAQFYTQTIYTYTRRSLGWRRTRWL
jgi:hypothetical protein